MCGDDGWMTKGSGWAARDEPDDFSIVAFTVSAVGAVLGEKVMILKNLPSRVLSDGYLG